MSVLVPWLNLQLPLQSRRRKTKNPNSRSLTRVVRLLELGGRRKFEETKVGKHLGDFCASWSCSKWALSILSHGLGWKWTSPPPKPSCFFFSKTKSKAAGVRRQSSTKGSYCQREAHFPPKQTLMHPQGLKRAEGDP